MKHYEISKTRNGWTAAKVVRPDGTVDTYNNFFNRKEAEAWCYAKIRYYYGRTIANNEIQK